MKNPPPDLMQRLLDVSEQILAAEPPLRLEDIALLVGTSRAKLYYYFPGREGLVAHLLTAHAQAGASAIDAAVDPDSAPEQRLRAMVSAMIAYLAKNPGVCAGLLSAVGASREVLEVNDTWIGRPLRELLAEGQNRGVFTLGTPADAANSVMGAALLGVLGRAMSGGDPGDRDFQRKLLDQVVRGVLARPSDRGLGDGQSC
jgi:AcrR family transcriptional regulator